MTKSKEKKPKNMQVLYGAAFGFDMARRVKPVHFTTGFFTSVLGKSYEAKLLNYAVAFADGKEMTGNYELEELHPILRDGKQISLNIGLRELHDLRKQLRCLANNDEAVFQIYGKKAGFGCDYSTSAHDILTLAKDNDGFSGQFTKAVLEQTVEGQWVLEFAQKCMYERLVTLRQVFQPLIDPVAVEIDLTTRYENRFGHLETRRLKSIAKRMSAQTTALKALCENAEMLFASETKLRALVIGLCIWLFRYVIEEGLSQGNEECVLLVDYLGDPASRMRSQSRWSYARVREAIIASFKRFKDEGRFEDCIEAWNYIEQNRNGRPEFSEFYGTLALRSGLAQPRASRVTAKHFELQPDTLRILLLSVLHEQEGLVPISEVLQRLYETWNLVFGGRSDDSELLSRLGYRDLDQDHDLTPNANALISMLTELGLATQYSDGLVMCHSRARF